MSNVERSPTDVRSNPITLNPPSPNSPLSPQNDQQAYRPVADIGIYCFWQLYLPRLYVYITTAG